MHRKKRKIKIRLVIVRSSAASDEVKHLWSSVFRSTRDIPCKSRINERATKRDGHEETGVAAGSEHESHTGESSSSAIRVDSLTCPSDDKFSALALKDILVRSLTSSCPQDWAIDLTFKGRYEAAVRFYRFAKRW